MVERNVQGSLPGGSAVWLVATAGTALTAAFFYPGYLNGDSSWQYKQGLELEYNDMHPVIMSWLWTYLDRVIQGSGGLFLMTTGLFWIGLASFTRDFTRSRNSFLAATFLVGLSPPVFSMLSQIHKDVGMVAGLLLGTALLVRADRSRSLWPLVLAVPAFWYAVAVRHNGAAAVLPFTIWMSFLLARDHLANRRGAFLASPLRKIILGTGIVLAMMGTSTLATRAILGEKGVHTPYQQFLFAYDLLGISVGAGHDFFPEGVYDEPSFELAELEKIYHPHTIFFAYWGEPGPRHLAIKTDAASVDALAASWSEAIRREPWSYFKHRVVLFLAHLGIGENAPFRKLEFFGSEDFFGRRYAYKGPNVFGMPHNHWLTEAYAAAGGSTYHPRAAESLPGMFWAEKTGLLFRPWPYLLLGLLCVAFAWRRGSAHWFYVALLGTSSILYVLPHLAIGVSAELRYMWWPILVSLLQTILVVDGEGRRLATSGYTSGDRPRRPAT